MPDEYGKTGLHWAAETDQIQAAQTLLDAGADIEAKTSWGATALDWAATMGSVGVGDLLVAGGASLNIRDARYDSTPEGWAREGGHMELAALLG